MSKNTLNKEQKEAVEYTDGPLLIVAGAGTGKTTVITKKIATLIQTGKAKPEEILALTFTDKAAGEMEERVDALLKEGYLDLHISTFHTFCQRILEQHGLDVGIPNTSKLLSQTDSWLLMRKHIYDFNLNYYRPLGNPAKHIHELIKHFSKCKDELISPEEYIDYAKSVRVDTDQIHTEEKERVEELANTYSAYNQLLLDNESLDFGDLIYYAVKLLEKRPNIKEKLQQRFKYILVDEFQDVNWAQYKLVQLLSEKNQLTVVGDDDQSIYAFRGANVANILRFKKDYKDAKEIVLNKNYRSGQTILDTSYTSITHNNPNRLEVKLSINKKLDIGTKEQGTGEVVRLHCESLHDEVYITGEHILKLQEKEDITWSDIAILVRANNHAEPFLQMLEKKGIPYEFLASNGLYRQPIVLDAINFFKLLDSYRESHAVYRLLCLPFLSMSENDIHKLTGFAKRKSVSYYEALKRGKEYHLSEEGVKISDKLLSLIHTGMKHARDKKPSTVLYEFLDQSGYLAYLTKEEEKENKKVIHQIYQLNTFLEMLNTFEEANPEADVRAFVDQFEHITNSGDKGKMSQSLEQHDGVQVMTVHGSKGLEFKHVFIVNLVEGRFPARKRGQGIPLPEVFIKEQLEEGDTHLEEERRLFYVALTRAKEAVYLVSGENYGGVRKKKISRFIQELHDDVQAPQKANEQHSTKKENETEPMIYNTPKAFSFSQIKRYETCPYQYKLAHILHIPTKSGPALSFGSTIHNTLQKFYEQIQEKNNISQQSLFDITPKKPEPKDPNVIEVPTLEELLTIYTSCWINDWYQSKTQRESYKKKGEDILKTFYETHTGKWQVPVTLEGSFKIVVGDSVIRGRIDRIDQKEDGSLEIIDYKTGKTKEKLKAEDKEQLLIYQIATKTLPAYRHLGETSMLTFYYLNDNIKTSFLGTDKELEKIEQKIQTITKNIKDNIFPPKPNSHTCGYCDFKNICEYKAT